MRRSFAARALIALVGSFLLIGLVAGCGWLRPVPRHRNLQPLWSDYLALPESRALVIAGELRRNHWVAGASGGHATLDAAVEKAMDECLERRGKMRMQAPCLVYARGDEIVWPHE